MVGMDDGSGGYDDGAEMVRMLRVVAAVVDGSGGGANSAAYKGYYGIASGAAPPKTKASVRKTQSSSDTTMPPLTAVGTRLSTSAKGKQPAKSSKAKGLSVLSEVAMTEAEQMKLAIKRSLRQTYIS
uniref:Uncharacterized protein n=1 Tax=Tanacetum cinerariifolium TaxID=118510 RepID=A0A6L2N9N0_TANCI|nr:hypothetical protein [Tanacetum cinerariifolium]